MYGEDDYLTDDRVVIRTPLGAIVTPVSLRRMGEAERETFRVLQTVGLEIEHLEQHVRSELVPAAREAGFSWSAIGAALGITGEGARRRYGRSEDS